MLRLSSLNVTGTSYLGDIIIDADNITTNNILTKAGNITFWNLTRGEVMRITNEGRIFIGRTTPISTISGLEVSSGEIVDATTFPRLSLIDTDSTTTDTVGGVLLFQNSSGDNAGRFGFAGSNGLLVIESIDALGNISLRTGGSTAAFSRLFIDSDGNVGIGTTTPSNTLDVRGIINSSGIIYYNNGTVVNSTFFTTMNNTNAIQQLINDTMLRLSSLNVTGTSYLGNIIIDADNITTNNILSKSGNITFRNYSTEFMRITDKGSIGIGTDNPTQKLQISNGNLMIENIDPSNAIFLNNTDSTNGIWHCLGLCFQSSGFRC